MNARPGPLNDRTGRSSPSKISGGKVSFARGARDLADAEVEVEVEVEVGLTLFFRATVVPATLAPLAREREPLRTAARLPVATLPVEAVCRFLPALAPGRAGRSGREESTGVSFLVERLPETRRTLGLDFGSGLAVEADVLVSTLGMRLPVARCGADALREGAVRASPAEAFVGLPAVRFETELLCGLLFIAW